MGMTWRKPGFGFLLYVCSYLLRNIRINPQKQHKSSLLKCNANKLELMVIPFPTLDNPNVYITRKKFFTKILGALSS